MSKALIPGALVALVTLAVSASAAHSADPFFKGKTLTIVTSTGAGGTYDTIARAVARHIPKHLAGDPTTIVQNMPGGGHMRATNYLYNVAPKDGTVIATIHNGVPLHQVIDGRGVRFDVAKFNWLGSPGADNSGVIVWRTSKVKSYEDALKKSAVVGATGSDSWLAMFPRVMNKVLGTKFKVVVGYKSSEEINVAMERGEVEARVFGLTSIYAHHSDWVREKKIRFLAQVGSKRDPRLADVPLLTEVAKTEEQRQILKLISSPTSLGRPFIAPPALPAKRVATLRKAFDETFADKGFLAEMAKFRIEINYLSGADLEALVKATVNTPKAFVAKAKKLIPKRKRHKKKAKKKS